MCFGSPFYFFAAYMFGTSRGEISVFLHIAAIALFFFPFIFIVNAFIRQDVPPPLIFTKNSGGGVTINIHIYYKELRLHSIKRANARDFR